MLMTPNATALDNELLKVSLSPIAALLDDPHVTDIMVYRQPACLQSVDAVVASSASQSLGSPTRT